MILNVSPPRENNNMLIIPAMSSYWALPCVCLHVHRKIVFSNWVWNACIVFKFDVTVEEIHRNCMQIFCWHDHIAFVDLCRMTVAFFCLSSLDLLGALELVERDRSKILNWIYSLQVIHQSKGRKPVSWYQLHALWILLSSLGSTLGHMEIGEKALRM